MQTEEDKPIRIPTVPVWSIQDDTEVLLKEGDEFGIMDPDLIVDREVMKSIFDVQNYLKQMKIDPDFAPFSIDEMYKFDGKNYISFVANFVQCNILANICTMTHRYLDGLSFGNLILNIVF